MQLKVVKMGVVLSGCLKSHGSTTLCSLLLQPYLSKNSRSVPVIV